MPKGQTTTISAAELRDVKSLRESGRAVLDAHDDGSRLPKRDRDRLAGTLDRLDRHEAKREAE